MSDSTAQLVNKIKSCHLCQARLPRLANPILQASQHSKILIAGQAPGAITDEKNRPFDDASGRRLRQWLGVTPEQFYDAKNFAIVPMGFCYPGKGKNGDLPPLSLCADTWRTPLLKTLTQIELTLILGKYAIEWHLKSKESMTSLARDWQQQLIQGYLVLPHPSPRNNRWFANNKWFEQQVIPPLRLAVQTLIDKNTNA